MRTGPALIAALLLAIGLVIGGWFIGNGFREGRQGAPYVTVRGLAERDVMADLASWTFRFTAAGPDLAEVQSEIERDGEAVRSFLLRNGFSADEISLQDIEVQDRLTQVYDNTNVSQNRFIITQVLELRTAKVQAVLDALGQVSELVRAGVVLVPQGRRVTYTFTGLNAVKPEMVAEATMDARKSAEQFANDSGAEVGGIRQASQGYFSILPRAGAEYDADATPYKTVRVVTTVDFYLDD